VIQWLVCQVILLTSLEAFARSEKAGVGSRGLRAWLILDSAYEAILMNCSEKNGLVEGCLG